MDDEVIIISDTIQEFCGERFYLCGKYFQHNGKRLHRAVWEHFNGEIPEGYHVHHIDEDRSNNDIENLSLMPGIDHMNLHAREEKRRANGHRAILFAIAAAPEWHHSEEGKEWHGEHAKAFWESVEPKTYICDCCGKEYLSRKLQKTKLNFCGQNCRAKYARRKKAGLL